MRYGLPRWLSGKESPANAGDVGLIPGWEDPLEEEVAAHSIILAWEIPRTEEPGRLQSMGLDTTELLSMHVMRYNSHIIQFTF